MARTWKEVFKFVEGAGKYSVGGYEGLLHSIAVMHVYVEIKDPFVVLQQFQYRDDAIVDVAEAGRFLELCVVKPTRSVDGYVGQPHA